MNAFKRNLLLGFGLSLLLLMTSAVLSFISIRKLISSNDWVDHTNRVIRKLDDITLTVTNAQADQRAFLVTNDKRFLQSFNGAYSRAVQYVQEVKALTADNAEQQADMGSLNTLIDQRFAALQRGIDIRGLSDSATAANLNIGQATMERLQQLTQRMKGREEALLAERTEQAGKWSSTTPVFIVVASLLALLVTAVSFFRVTKDYSRRQALQAALEKKEEDIGKRIAGIERIAGQISAGDYGVRASDEEKDTLGSLAGSLNAMAGSLQNAFEDLQEKQWLQTGVAGLNDALIGDKDVPTLTADALSFVAEYTGSNAGVLYLLGNDNRLLFGSGFAVAPNEKNKTLSLNEGLAGQAAASQKAMEASGIEAGDYKLLFASGEVRPRNVIAFPVLYNRQLKGVMELASMQPFTAAHKTFFQTVSLNTGIALASAEGRKRVYELLEETQAQAEELQTQHSELENINAELTAQSERLQASEEELRVQQEELQQANGELEERSRLLEERNEMIAERNLEIGAKAEALEISTRYKSEFLANMSHELRTPLNSILLLSRLLSENNNGNLSTDQVEYAQVINNSGNGLLRLIDEILDLSKIESGKMDLEWSDVAVADIVRDTKALFAPVAAQQGLDFRIESDANLPSHMETDRLRLEQIIRNLLSNAMKFTSQGSVVLSIAPRGDAIEFAVQDTGIGIPLNKQQGIFEAFQQADGSTRRKYGGTGLGLSISRELAKLLGGEVSLHSEEGKGSRFVLTLPRKRGAVLRQPAEVPSAPAPAHPLPPPSHDKYISDVIPASVPDDRDAVSEGDKVLLIIEDDTAFARSLLDYARSRGYKGVVAVRGDEGVELASRLKPTGILLDLQLPVKSGWEVMEDLKRNPLTRPIPVHMMSSHSERMKSLTRGAVDFINKPMAFEQMAEAFKRIEEALSRHPKKVLIVEENPKHAQALSYYLQGFDVTSEIKHNVGEGIAALTQEEVDCVILDMGVPAAQGYATLERVKQTPGLENLPIIIFTGKNLSHVEEMKIKKYADSIVIKTAHSYQRILDEVSLFLHLVEGTDGKSRASRHKKMGGLKEVLQGKTVLIADDDVRNIFSLTRALEAYDVKVLSAVDGKEALKQLEETPGVDAVLMDMMMPEMDGYESTRRIREQPRFRNLPVIAVTAKAMTGDREKCIQAGASDYITKPVDVDQLTSLLRVWLYE